MTRGQDDWLGLSCATLSFATSCPFSGASKRFTILTYWSAGFLMDRAGDGKQRNPGAEASRPGTDQAVGG
jgi:hypothetical protein